MGEGAGGPSTTSVERSDHTTCVARGRTYRAILLAIPITNADVADELRACPRGGAAPSGPDDPVTPCRGADGPYGSGPPRSAAVHRRPGQQHAGSPGSQGRHPSAHDHGTPRAARG